MDNLAYAPASSPRTKRAANPPALLYRVYHDASGGLNSPTGFRAGLFSIPGQSLAPAPPTDYHGAILPVFVSWHCWHHTLSSPFISCTDSLIMALHKARRAEAAGLNPHVAVINAARAASNDDNNDNNSDNSDNTNLFPARPLVAAARRRGLVPGMRYRGHRELLAWGAISQHAIVADLPFATLRAADLGVADLLALDDIDPGAGSQIASIRRALLRQEVVLAIAPLSCQKCDAPSTTTPSNPGSRALDACLMPSAHLVSRFALVKASSVPKIDNVG
ncbi:hypothetical protein UCDDS831_g05069 [Diplodia seriata]|uniref:DUF7587 domain-containing protein n=1 Tax=Diplodia seriata TaxID=420778 RepID=A0A0G2EBU4_9PEZI|nr:hypothetical protein UCDDS831_g05069 [Diplodia seriata]